MTLDYVKKDRQLGEFFSSFDKKKRYLLAFSGGPDSTYLFYVLKSFGVSFVAAHVDHRWRPTSGQEAMGLRDFCEKEGVPFFCRVLNSGLWEDGDLENVARQSRYQFFKEILESERLAGVFVAHHADDKVETILKRVLEGASLTHLSGPKSKAVVNELPILRPLLHLTKKQILLGLQEYKASYITDSSNEDESFLRGRMRKSIIPYLQKSFGKNILFPLLSLAKDSEELAEYIRQEAMGYLEASYEEGTTSNLPLPCQLLQRPFLAKAVIKQFLSSKGVTASRHTLSMILVLALGKGEKKMRVQKKVVKVSLNLLSLCPS